VWVHVPADLDVADAYMSVIDDGVSMDFKGLKELWQVGDSPKRQLDGEDVVHANRPPIGKFGIGKLATYVLAEKITFICKDETKILAVTMDFGSAQGGVSDARPMSLAVVALSSEEARATLERVLGTQDEAFRSLSAADAPSTWTAAIMSDLKPRGQAIERGRLRWILSTSLPLGDDFLLWFNNERLESSKLSAKVDWEFVVGTTDRESENWAYAQHATENAAGRPGVDLPDVGWVAGSAQLFDTSLKGKAERFSRSHGFFVRVRGRLINLDDETFGIDVELHHGVLTRFRMEVFADGLDSFLSSPRESIQDSPALRTLRRYLLAVFNRARSYRSKQEDTLPNDLLAAAARIAQPPAALSTGPLRRVLQMAIDGDTLVGALLDIDQESLKLAVKAIASGDRLLKLVVIEPLGHDEPLVKYSVERRAAIVNADHPFVSNYLDDAAAGEALRLVGVTELLTQIYMLDEDIEPRLVERVLARRDEFLRALVSIHPRSAPVVARQLRDAKGKRDELEDAVADALELLGFAVTRIGGTGKPDGIARASLGAHSEGGGSLGYSLTYDAKSSGKEAIKAATAGTQTLRKHRDRHGARYSLLVAPGFQGDTGSDTSIVENCTTDKVTPITVEQLAQVVLVFPFKGVSPSTLQGLFECHTPVDVTAWVSDLIKREPSQAPPIRQILDLTRELSDRQDAVTIDALSAVLKTRNQIEISNRDLRALVQGLASLAPDGLWFDGDRFALNADITTVIHELRATVDPLDDAIAGVYKKVLASLESA